MWDIFGWIRRRRMNRRELLRYWDGSAFRYGDPFLLWRRLKHHETLTIDAELWQAADRGDEPECTQLVKAVAETFGVDRFDGERGLSDWEILDLYAMLLDYLDTLKKKHNPQPISSPPTDSESSTSPEPPSEPVDSGLASG